MSHCRDSDAGSSSTTFIQSSKATQYYVLQVCKHPQHIINSELLTLLKRDEFTERNALRFELLDELFVQTC